ncbi:MAG: hypothetical protein NZ959_05595 [Armatimonadetes bacterium]|nr:hypothetical protein [Armatimonadota bacterium]MDW8122046.1 hypothetical protein [Armatimonadota bacterium]
MTVAETNRWRIVGVTKTQPPRRKKQEPVRWRVIDVRDHQDGIILVVTPEWRNYLSATEEGAP